MAAAIGLAICMTERQTLALSLIDPCPEPPREEQLRRWLGVAKSISIEEARTNREKCAERRHALCMIGELGGTNCIEYLSTIWRTPKSQAGCDAMSAALHIVARTGMPHAITNLAERIIAAPVFLDEARLQNVSLHVRGLKCELYMLLGCMLEGDYGWGMVHLSEEQRMEVRKFLVKRACIETGNVGHVVDTYASKVDPAYRHSQLRRDNLESLRADFEMSGSRMKFVKKAQQDAAQDPTP